MLSNNHNSTVCKTRYMYMSKINGFCCQKQKKRKNDFLILSEQAQSKQSHVAYRTYFPYYNMLPFLADRFNKASCLFCRNSIKCKTSSVKRDFPLSEVLLPITIMDLIGNWKFKYSHASHLAP